MRVTQAFNELIWKRLMTTQLLPEAVACRCSLKKVFLKSLRNSQETTCGRDSFLIKWQAWGLQLQWKEDWHRYFSVNFAKFLRAPPLAASLLHSTIAASVWFEVYDLCYMVDWERTQGLSDLTITKSLYDSVRVSLTDLLFISLTEAYGSLLE